MTATQLTTAGRRARLVAAATAAAAVLPSRASR